MPTESVAGLHDWTKDEYGCWNLRVGAMHLWCQPLMSTCSRGKWSANLLDPLNTLEINDADNFPRYYMDEERAKLELSAWLVYRLKSLLGHG